MKRTETLHLFSQIIFVDLSVKLVQTKRHKVYYMVYILMKWVLLLPVAMSSVERVFSELTLVKLKLRNKLGDSLLDDCLVTFIERNILSKWKKMT